MDDDRPLYRPFLLTFVAGLICLITVLAYWGFAIFGRGSDLTFAAAVTAVGVWVGLGIPAALHALMHLHCAWTKDGFNGRGFELAVIGFVSANSLPASVLVRIAFGKLFGF